MEGATALDAVFDKVQPATTFEETVERLGTAIRLGLLGPGTRLPPERELAEQLGISRSTLRQALTTLVQSGHLISMRGRTGGTFVAEKPPLKSGVETLPADWRETLDGRLALEAGSALLAAERGDEAAFDRLDALVEEMDAPQLYADFRRADVRFHITIAEATGTPRLVAGATEVQGALSTLIDLIDHPDPVMRRANEQHREIVACLRAGNGVGAVEVLRAHLAGTERVVSDLLGAETASTT
jgi:GntR family transcriptional repressor for pyruvate dehydrogenase complex